MPCGCRYPAHSLLVTTEPADRIWRLHRDGEVIAELVVNDGDFPWLYARLEARPGFEAIRNVPEFLLHIEGDTAWWRWNDEPFDEDDAG